MLAKIRAKAPSVHPKVAGSTAGAAIASVILGVLKAVGVHLDPTEIGVIGTLATLIAGYLTPAKNAPTAGATRPKLTPPLRDRLAAFRPPGDEGYCCHQSTRREIAALRREIAALRREIAALNERLTQQMADYTALQADVAELASNVAAVQSAVQTLEAASSSEQATVDAIDADVKAANTALEALIPTPPAPVASAIVVSLSPATLPSDGASQAVISATVTDSAGAPLDTETVVFTSSDPAEVVSATTNAGAGVYTATVTASTTPGAIVITATDGTVTGTAALTQS